MLLIFYWWYEHIYIMALQSVHVFIITATSVFVSDFLQNMLLRISIWEYWAILTIQLNFLLKSYCCIWHYDGLTSDNFKRRN